MEILKAGHIFDFDSPHFHVFLDGCFLVLIILAHMVNILTNLSTTNLSLCLWITPIKGRFTFLCQSRGGVVYSRRRGGVSCGRVTYVAGLFDMRLA